MVICYDLNLDNTRFQLKLCAKIVIIMEISLYFHSFFCFIFCKLHSQLTTGVNSTTEGMQ